MGFLNHLRCFYISFGVFGSGVGYCTQDVQACCSLKGQSTRCNSVPCSTASMAQFLHMTHLILSRRWGSSSRCNTVTKRYSVFVWVWSGEVCTMADVEEAALLAIIVACPTKKNTKILELNNYFQMKCSKFLGLARLINMQKRHAAYVNFVGLKYIKIRI